MCGIGGIVHWDNSNYFSELQAMQKAIDHRGPDGSDCKVFDGAGLVHSRLSIVDVEGGGQPMDSSNGRFSIVFNGEIYGFRRLKEELDYPFRTQSDTEVLLAMYIKHGKEMLKYINGMFAFAIWDKKEKKLFCARDRFGEKPFYYALTSSGTFIFASEVKALLASGFVQKDLDDQSVSHFFRKLYVHPNRSIYKNVRTLKPGCMLELDGRGLAERRYWDIPATTQEEVTVEEAVENIQMLMRRAVQDQLVADVPVGAFLSGGLDSSSVVASAVRSKPDLMTLSYRFKSGLDEGDYAASVASLYNTKHVELFERDFDVAESMLDMAQIYDEPFADSSNIPTYQICKEARKHCKVVLTGDGADELFGGYSWKYRPLYHQVSGRNSTKLENLAYFLVLKVFHKFNKNLGTLYQAIGRRNLYLNRSLPESIDDLYWFFSEPEIKALGLPSWMEEDPENRFSDRFTDLNQALKHDMMDYMAGDILVKIDRASMKAGVELRAPFLDKELAEYVASLPSRLKLDSQRDKIILREAFSASWPEKIKRRTKQGFGSPVERWLSSDSMTEVKSHYLSRGRRICDHLNPDVVESFKQGSCMRTWAMLNFSIWCETWDI